MGRWKVVLAWIMVASMFCGSFVPVQSVHADVVTEADTSESNTAEDNVTENETTEANTSEDNTTENETTEESGLKDSEKVVSTLSPVSAKVIVLDPGHCKVHPGACGNGLREEVAALDIAKACKSTLKNYGEVTIYMTREDGSCCRELELGACLTARNNYAKMLDADFLISMHLNAGSTNGANVLTAYKSGYNDKIRVETQKFGKIALKKLKALGIANRGLLLRKSESGNRYNNGSLADYYSIVRNGVVQQIPSVIIEHGYISSSYDVSKFFNTAAKRKKVGKADAKAIISYYGLKKKVTAGSFKKIDGDTYYVTSSGKKVTGWVKSGEKWYCFDEKNGVMKTGFVECDGETVYLSPSTGEMVVGWFVVGGGKYLAKGNGAIVKNQLYTDGVYTYMFNKKGRLVKKGFHSLENKTYYVDKYRHVVSGVVKISGQYYGFDPETKEKLYGYQKVNGKYYYFDKSTGAAVTKKILKIKGKKYYFGKTGARATGWVKISRSKYYFKKNGVMARGWTKIKGKYYYFSKTTGKMQKSKWIGKYYVNSKGVRTKKRR